VSLSLCYDASVISPYLTLSLILVLTLAIVLAFSIVMMALFLLRPPRMTDGKAAYVLKRLSPGDLGLPYSTTRFVVRDEVTGEQLPIAAWWIPCATANGKCVIIVHGYADAKVGGIAWAPTWHALGWNVLAIDLRAHGESGGRYTTAGFHERHDLAQVIDQLRAEQPKETQTLALFGISLGAAVVLAASVMRDDLAAVVLECPFADYRHAVANHSTIMGMPLHTLQPLAIRAAERIARADFNAVRPIDLIPQCPAPLMIFQACSDPFVADDVKLIEDAMTKREQSGLPTKFTPIPEAGHVLGMCADPEGYREQLRAFLDQYTLATLSSSSS
jgi:alpha-beta hydrolase superfamily lysophospholipase